MKRKILFLIISVATFSSCFTMAQTPRFLFLTGQQLQPLGIMLTDQGLFYKNFNPNWQTDNEKYPYLGFLSNETYLTVKRFTETDNLKAENKYERVFIKMAASNNDFYPLLIGNTKGQMSLDKYTVLNKEMKLLPVAVCMAETKIATRQDTIIIWFKPTESIKKSLPDNINLDDYLQVPKIAKP